MSDNRRIYRTIRMAIKQLFPPNRKVILPPVDHLGCDGGWDCSSPSCQLPALLGNTG